MDDDSFGSDEIHELGRIQRTEFLDDLTGRLRSRCGGLLEVEVDSRACFCASDAECTAEHDRKLDLKVVFMRRTVFEFLGDGSTWSLECLQTPSEANIATNLALIFIYSVILSL